ncbi:response regulator [Oleiharenicola lentus]|uniref:response regulator n=1 Tax=Oleiharenicola lentus TaxID=2508720 RepID=UPI003F66410D
MADASSISLSPLFYADDSEADYFLFERALARAGVNWPVIRANNGWEAITHLNEQLLNVTAVKPGLILLDKKMPQADGIDVLKWVRERPAFDATPVVMYSTSDLVTDVALAREHGADAYLVKLASTNDQLKQVHDLLHLMKTGRHGKWVVLHGGVG